MTSSNGNTFCVTGHLCGKSPGTPGEFPTQRPVTRSFDVFFDLRLNKWLSKQWWGGWFETLSRPLWRHRNDHKIAPLPVNQPWKVRIMTSHKFTNNSQHSHKKAKHMYGIYSIWIIPSHVWVKIYEGKQDRKIKFIPYSQETGTSSGGSNKTTSPVLSFLHLFSRIINTPLIARFIGPTQGPSGGDRTQVGPLLAPWTLLSGTV